MRGNQVHDTATIVGEVELGSGNRIGPHCVLEGPLIIGDDNVIGPHAVIGTPGDEIWDRDYDTTGKVVVIGSDCKIREHTTIHKPVYGERTTIGDRVYVMHGGYVAHDSVLADGAILAQNVAIGGVSRVHECGYVAIGAVLHQQTVCGAYAIVGAAAAAVKSLPPFTRFVPGQPLTLNAYAIERYGFRHVQGEIEAYVHERRAPADPRLAELVRRYEEDQERTGRGEYR